MIELSRDLAGRVSFPLRDLAGLDGFRKMRSVTYFIRYILYAVHKALHCEYVILQTQLYVMYVDTVNCGL